MSSATISKSYNVIDTPLRNYILQIKNIKMLTEEQEKFLVEKWCKEADMDAAHQLVVSHLKLVVKIAFGFKNYGLPIWDLISEGNIGLMKAVKKFKLGMNCRLSTYAMWWIKANIQSYILKSWSLVKIGTAALKKRLFCNFNKIQKQIDLDKDNHEHVGYDYIEKASNVLSLNHMYGDDCESEFGNMISCDNDTPEEDIIANQISNLKVDALKAAVKNLNDREKNIIMHRRLLENPTTLQELSNKYGISKERVRQIEERAMEKLKIYVNKTALDTK